jgi:hypothetical protein
MARILLFICFEQSRYSGAEDLAREAHTAPAVGQRDSDRILGA